MEKFVRKMAPIIASLVMLVFGTSTMPVLSSAYLETKSPTSINDTSKIIDLSSGSLLPSTTKPSIPVVTFQIREIPSTTTSTTIVKIVTTTIKKPVVTTIPVQTTISKISANIDGPPHNITSLVGCISYYESTWGEDPNVFQFEQTTWEYYGGKGSPSNAPYWRQEEVFWLAWADDGHHHWAAQKGRCF